jgi:hypothetical protein
VREEEDEQSRSLSEATVYMRPVRRDALKWWGGCGCCGVLALEAGIMELEEKVVRAWLAGATGESGERGSSSVSMM